MRYAKVYNDADSHIMETKDWLTSYAHPKIHPRLPTLDLTRAAGRVAIAFVPLIRSPALSRISVPVPLVVILLAILGALFAARWPR